MAEHDDDAPTSDRPAHPEAGARLAAGRASASAAARARASARPPAAATRAPARARAPSDRARFEGGQNPIHMRMRKLRGPHMKKSMPFEPFRTHTQPVNLADLEARFDAGAEVTLGGAARARAWPRARTSRSRSSPRASSSKTLDRPRARLQRRPRARRSRPPAAPASVRRATVRSGRCSRRSSTPSRVAEIRKKLALHGGDAGALPARRLHPGAGRRRRRGQRRSRSNFGGSNILGLLNLFSRRRPVADRALRAGDHALHHGLDHPAAADRSSCPRWRSSQKEGEVGQARITQYTRYLTVGLAFAQSIGYVFLFQLASAPAPAQPIIANFDAPPRCS